MDRWRKIGKTVRERKRKTMKERVITYSWLLQRNENTYRKRQIERERKRQ